MTICILQDALKACFSDYSVFSAVAHEGTAVVVQGTAIITGWVVIM